MPVTRILTRAPALATRKAGDLPLRIEPRSVWMCTPMSSAAASGVSRLPSGSGGTVRAAPAPLAAGAPGGSTPASRRRQSGRGQPMAFDEPREDQPAARRFSQRISAPSSGSFSYSSSAASQ